MAHYAYFYFTVFSLLLFQAQTPVNGQAASASQHSPPGGQTGSRQHSPTPPTTAGAPALSTSTSSTTSLERQLTSEYLRHAGGAAPTAFRPPHELPSPFFPSSNGLFRTAAGGFAAGAYTPPAHHHSPVLSHSQMAAHMQNGAFRK